MAEEYKSPHGIYFVDKNNLDEESLRNPQELDDAWRDELKAELLKNIATDKLEAARAKADLRIRSMSLDELNDAFDLNLKVIREDSIKSLVSQDSLVVKRTKELRKAEFAYKMYKADRFRSQARQESIKNLIKAYGDNYFSRIEGRAFKELRSNKLREIHRMHMESVEPDIGLSEENSEPKTDSPRTRKKRRRKRR